MSVAERVPLAGTTLTGLEKVDAADGPLALVRAWPGETGSLTLELRGPDGALIAGRWPAGDGPDVQVGVAADGRRVALLRHGADPALPGLAALAASPGARLLVHRPGRRGVVALSDGTFAKAVRPRRLGALVAATEQAAGMARGFAVPTVVRVDVAAGVVRCAALPGAPLHARPGDTTAAAAAGAAVAALHATPAPAALPTHTAADEADVVSGWVARLASAVAPDSALSPAARAAARATACLGPVTAALATGVPGPAGPLHRDLHDKQILVDGERVGLLDCDTLARGEAALDLANLLVHLELRALQGTTSRSQASAAAAAVLGAYAPCAGTTARLPAYATAVRLRLACVYAFRPGPAALVVRLLDSLAAPPLGSPGP